MGDERKKNSENKLTRRIYIPLGVINLLLLIAYWVVSIMYSKSLAGLILLLNIVINLAVLVIYLIEYMKTHKKLVRALDDYSKHKNQFKSVGGVLLSSSYYLDPTAKRVTSDADFSRVYDTDLSESQSKQQADVETANLEEDAPQQMFDVEENIIVLMLKNFKESKEYFSISKNQAKSSFRLSVASCAIGMMLLVASAVLALLIERIEPAIITVISGAIAELIAATVFWVHNKSALQLNHYYDALHENEQFLSAVNVVDKISEDKRDEVYTEIIRSQIVQTPIPRAEK